MAGWYGCGSLSVDIREEVKEDVRVKYAAMKRKDPVCPHMDSLCMIAKRNLRDASHLTSNCAEVCNASTFVWRCWRPAKAHPRQPGGDGTAGETNPHAHLSWFLEARCVRLTISCLVSIVL